MISLASRQRDTKLVFVLLVKIERQAGGERVVGRKKLRGGVSVGQDAHAPVRGSENLDDYIIYPLARLSGKYLVKKRGYLLLASYFQELLELVDGFFGAFKLIGALALLVVYIADAAVPSEV